MTIALTSPADFLAARGAAQRRAEPPMPPPAEPPAAEPPLNIAAADIGHNGGPPLSDETVTAPPKRGRGRPRGSKNRPKPAPNSPAAPLPLAAARTER